jgi:hypothetical protein
VVVNKEQRREKSKECCVVGVFERKKRELINP